MRLGRYKTYRAHGQERRLDLKLVEAFAAQTIERKGSDILDS